MEKREQLVKVDVKGLGEIIAPMGVLNTISIAFGDSARQSIIKYPDLPEAARLYEDYSKQIYDVLKGLGLYDNQ